MQDNHCGLPGKLDHSLELFHRVELFFLRPFGAMDRALLFQLYQVPGQEQLNFRLNLHPFHLAEVYEFSHLSR